MNKQHLQSVKENNKKEQNKVLKTIVIDEKEKLNSLVKKQKIVNEKIKITSSKLDSKSKQIKAEYIALEKFRDSLSEKELKLIKKEKELSAKEQEQDNKISETKTKLENIRKEINLIISSKKEELNFMENKITMLNALAKDKEEQYELTKDNFNTMFSDLQTLNIEKEEVAKKLDDSKKELNRFIIDSNKQKEQISSEIEKMKESISIPMETLNAKDYDLTKREKNLAVMIGRFRREFKKIYPNQDPKI